MRYDPAIPCDGSGLVSTNIALSRQCCLGNHLELQFAKLLLVQIRGKRQKKEYFKKNPLDAFVALTFSLVRLVQVFTRENL